MTRHVLSETQSRILLALLLEGVSSSADILETSGISTSTSNKEKHLLANMGLIDTESIKGFTQNGFTRNVELRIT